MLTLKIPCPSSFAAALSPRFAPSPSSSCSPSPRPPSRVRFISPPIVASAPSLNVHPSRTHFTYTTKYHTQVLPKLAGPSNYSQWAANLERILTVQDLWSFVDPSASHANSPASLPSAADRAAARAYSHRKRRAFMVVLMSCTWPVQQKLAHCSDAAVAWLLLADFCEWAARDPPVGGDVGRHRFEYAFEGCRWEVWWLEGSANWEEWRLSLRVVLDAEGLGPASLAGLERNGEGDSREKQSRMSLAIVSICIEEGLRALVKKRGCRSGEDAIAVLERLCGRRRTESNKGLIDLKLRTN